MKEIRVHFTIVAHVYTDSVNHSGLTTRSICSLRNNTSKSVQLCLWIKYFKNRLSKIRVFFRPLPPVSNGSMTSINKYWWIHTLTTQAVHLVWRSHHNKLNNGPPSPLALTFWKIQVHLVYEEFKISINHTEVQNTSISSPTKRTNILQKFKNEKIKNSGWHIWCNRFNVLPHILVNSLPNLSNDNTLFHKFSPMKTEVGGQNARAWKVIVEFLLSFFGSW